MTDGGKGSKARPFSVAHEEYSKRWDAIFSRDGLDDKPNESEEKPTRNNSETQEVINYNK